ncbi:hypothetical protein [Aureispira anguillae]|uniref:Uncharacterized protein n=1 Tax=Aureispira anguillae TaxID=2864201 RepID=A0A915YJV8_9BACT|nr:hypothetical protein [Aureispira anguillae]BDS14302.1 hypothetical protein AsAng_0050810 [Aureispira anguillae]
MKLEAFSIVESMMALIVIMISFTAGMTIYWSILQGDAFPLRTKAKNTLHTVWLECQQTKRYLDEEITKDGFLIQKKVSPYKGYQAIFQQKEVYQVSLKAFSPKQDLVAEQEHLIVTED